MVNYFAASEFCIINVSFLDSDIVCICCKNGLKGIVEHIADV